MAEDGLEGGAVGAGTEGGDELHFATAFGAEERIGVINTLDEGGPAEFPADRHGRRQPGDDLAGGRGAGRLLFFRPEAAGFVSVPAIVADQMFAGLGDVLCEFGDEIQRFEMLEVALDGVRRFAVLIFIGKGAALGVLGADAAVDAEAAVFPGAHDVDDAAGDAAPFDEEREDAAWGNGCPALGENRGTVFKESPTEVTCAPCP